MMADNIGQDNLVFHLIEGTVTKDDVMQRPKVYPTWIEWMAKNGLIYVPVGFWVGPRGDDMPPLVCVTTQKARERIPDDIAEKLGIQPKEAR